MVQADYDPHNVSYITGAITTYAVILANIMNYITLSFPLLC